MFLVRGRPYMTSDNFCYFLTPLIRCFISAPLLMKSDLAEPPPPPLPSDVIYGCLLSNCQQHINKSFDKWQTYVDIDPSDRYALVSRMPHKKNRFADDDRRHNYETHPFFLYCISQDYGKSYFGVF